MKFSEMTRDLLSALCTARLAFPPITRNRDGQSKRTGQKYKYADLNALIDSTEPVLLAHGLLLVQSLEDGEGGTLRITSTLFHASSGQWLSAEISVEKPDDMQLFGMVSTYQKRYAQQALLNISTEEDDDAASLNGAPKSEKSAAAAHRRASEPVSTNGHTPAHEGDAALEHPTEAHLGALRKLAITVCMDEPEVYEDRLRRAMGVPKHASVSPRLLAKSMSMTAYMEVYGWYVNLQKQLEKSQKEASDGPVATSEESAAAQPMQPTASEGLPVDPPADSAAGSSSAPGPDPGDAAERDRQRIRAEVAGWDLRVPPEEVEHVIQHNPYSKARALLWKCRRQDTAA